MGLPEVSCKNIADLTPYKDENGKIHLMVDENHLGKRDAVRPLLALEDIINGEKLLSKREPVDPKSFFEPDGDNFKGGQKNFAGDVMIMDLNSKLPTLREISIFYEYMRNDIVFSQKLGDDNADLIVIAPKNDAISRLGLKPWQFPKNIENMEDDGALEADIQSAIENNIQEFVRSHIVDYDDSKSANFEELRCTILKSVAMEQSNDEGSGDILLKKENDQFYIASIRDEEFHLVEKVETGANGVILIVDTCLVFPQNV